MRLLNSICKVLADNYPDIPIHIKEVPKDFKRPCFLVQLVTDPKQIKSYNMIQLNPTFQIIYFGERDEANQVLAEPLYEADNKLEELFLLALALPVIPKTNAEENKRRYAKIESFNSSLRLGEGALYCDLTLNFTESVPHEDNSPIIEEFVVDIERKTL